MPVVLDTVRQAQELTEQAPVTAVPERLLLTLALLVVILLVLWAMLRNWRKRIGRQHWVQVPAPPHGFTAGERYAARYVASVRTEDWLDRIAARGLGMPGRADVLVGADGLLIERDGETELYLPGTLIEDVGSARGIAQEVYERDGLVAISWRSGERSITTGLRMASAQDHTAVIAAVRRMMGSGQDSEGKAGQ